MRYIFLFSILSILFVIQSANALTITSPLNQTYYLFTSPGLLNISFSQDNVNPYDSWYSIIQGDNWSYERFDYQRTGYVTNREPVNMALALTFNRTNKAKYILYGNDETIYYISAFPTISTNSHYLVAIYPNGTYKMIRMIHGSSACITTYPTLDNNNLYFGCNPSGAVKNMMGLSNDGTENGTLLFNVSILSATIASIMSPMVYNNNVIFVNPCTTATVPNITFMALDKTTGTGIWNLTTNGNIQSQPVMKDGIIYAYMEGIKGNDYENSTIAIYAENGSILWQYDDSSPTLYRLLFTDPRGYFIYNIVNSGSSAGFFAKYANNGTTAYRGWAQPKYLNNETVYPYSCVPEGGANCNLDGFIFDGDWSTSGYGSSGNCNCYVNYTITNGLSSDWTFNKGGTSCSGNTTVTIPQSCFFKGGTRKPTSIEMKITSTDTPQYGTSWSCWDGTGWQEIYSCYSGNANDADIYEQAMTWYQGEQVFFPTLYKPAFDYENGILYAISDNVTTSPTGNETDYVRMYHLINLTPIINSTEKYSTNTEPIVAKNKMYIMDRRSRLYSLYKENLTIAQNISFGPDIITTAKTESMILANGMIITAWTTTSEQKLSIIADMQNTITMERQITLPFGSFGFHAFTNATGIKDAINYFTTNQLVAPTITQYYPDTSAPPSTIMGNLTPLLVSADMPVDTWQYRMNPYICPFITFNPNITINITALRLIPGCLILDDVIQGAQIIEVTATNAAGTGNLYTVGIRIDTIYPIISSLVPATDSIAYITISSPSVMITGSFSDYWSGTNHTWVNDTRWDKLGTPSSISFNNTNASIGYYTILVSGNDTAGNTKSETMSFTVAYTTPPTPVVPSTEIPLATRLLLSTIMALGGIITFLAFATTGKRDIKDIAYSMIFLLIVVTLAVQIVIM